MKKFRNQVFRLIQPENICRLGGWRAWGCANSYVFAQMWSGSAFMTRKINQRARQTARFGTSVEMFNKCVSTESASTLRELKAGGGAKKDHVEPTQFLMWFTQSIARPCDWLALGIKESAMRVDRKADYPNPMSIDHVVSAQEQRLRNCPAQRFGGLVVDHEFKLRGLLDGKISRFCALQDLVDVRRCALV